MIEVMAVASARPIHPFPARMAPEIALARCKALPANALVLDPMAGSGTVLRAAADGGLRAMGCDLDPLAVLMAKVWTTPLDTTYLRAAASDLVHKARSMKHATPVPWIDNDPETAAFVDFWFGPKQQLDLRRISAILMDERGSIPDALRIALSRLIITKERGASLARDVSHSRPHRVLTSNPFDVLESFGRSIETIAPRLLSAETPATTTVVQGDARRLTGLRDAAVDAIITSPPYLNAIDYLRGHRLALVWLGYRLADIRAIRAVSVGAERAPDRHFNVNEPRGIIAEMGNIATLPGRIQAMVERYVLDLIALSREMRRVLRPYGSATLVVGNSCLRGVGIDNATAVVVAAQQAGLSFISRSEREIPPSRRYLPPPREAPTPSEPQRMRTEVVLTFRG